MQRQATQRVVRQVVKQQQRKMGGGPVGQHLLGTKQADYIQVLSPWGELPAAPGSIKTQPWQLHMGVATIVASVIATRALYLNSRPVRVEVEKVTVEHPDTKEPVYLFKPTGINKAGQTGIFSYNIVQAPQLEYTRRETVTAAKLALYNDEMDFWLKHGADSEKVLGRPFSLFKPEMSFVTDAQDASRYEAAQL